MYKIWKFDDIDEIFKRRFLMLNQGVEIYTKEKKSYFFNLFETLQCNAFFDNLQRLHKDKKYKFDIITKIKSDIEEIKDVSQLRP